MSAGDIQFPNTESTFGLGVGTASSRLSEHTYVWRSTLATSAWLLQAK